MYRIYEENMERLEKKLTRIKNKCEKYGCTFSYEVVGEEFVEQKVPYQEEPAILRYVLVEVEGHAKINDWMFVASIDFTEKGNILNRVNNSIEIPERYYTTAPICEHCNSNRKRKYAYIVMNTETGEFKQVGASCLSDFTHGLSAEGVAAYIQMYDELIKGEAPEEGYHCIRYIKTEEYLSYVFECIRHFGYARTQDSRPTSSRANDYYRVNHGGFCSYYEKEYREMLLKEMEDVNFNVESEETKKVVKEALEWIANQEESNNYMHNLKTACSLEYISSETGIVASLASTFNKELEKQARLAAEAEKAKVSNHVGNVGDRITIKVKKVKILTSWGTQWGCTYMYNITDENGNIFIWKTAKYFEEADTITATVKAHNEFRNTKQTEITRAKVA